MRFGEFANRRKNRTVSPTLVRRRSLKPEKPGSIRRSAGASLPSKAGPDQRPAPKAPTIVSVRKTPPTSAPLLP